MDEIALLCNLHADGPATLKVLRRAGLRTLPDVSRTDVRRLADTLGVSPSFARRFAREARLLAGRMGVEGFEVEEGAPAEAVLEREAHEPLSPALAVSTERAIIPESPPTRAMPWSERTPAVPPAGMRLVSFLIAGLDRQACDRLIAQGIRTLEELAAAPGLSLARRIEMPLPRLLDLQYLAQQRLSAPPPDADTESATPPVDDYVLQPAPRAFATPPQREAPAWRPDIGHLQPPLHVPVHADSEVAGPFA